MSHPVRAPTTSRARLCRGTILSILGLDHALTNSHENFPVGHPLWDCSRVNLLNFGVPTKPEASELPKGLALGRDGNIHIRLTGSIPLADVGWARRPHRQTSDQGLTLIPNCHILARALTTSRARLRHSTILFALGPDHALTVLFLGTHTRTSHKLPQGLVLGRDGNIHIRFTGSTLLNDNIQSFETDLLLFLPSISWLGLFPVGLGPLHATLLNFE
ncbi:hypothetical protein DVH24_015570 [Malus domestica]|uniref:Uncharacterized protein n=1 Tax=Malus domestica TaxID=3750 RepID=A0A498HHG8_MALDO|nr:hypothetical protein DVH24_015570 [Malus domestica]